MTRLSTAPPLQAWAKPTFARNPELPRRAIVLAGVKDAPFGAASPSLTPAPLDGRLEWSGRRASLFLFSTACGASNKGLN